MPAPGEDVHLGGNASAAQGGGHQQRVLHGDGPVLPGVPEEGGRGLGSHHRVQRMRGVDGQFLRAGQVAEAALVGKLAAGDHGVAKHHGVGAHLLTGIAAFGHEGRVMPADAQMARGMPAGGEAHDGDGGGIGCVLLRMGAHPGHCGRNVHQGGRMPVGRNAVPYHIGVETHGGKCQCHGLRLPGGQVLIAAAGADDHRGPQRAGSSRQGRDVCVHGAVGKLNALVLHGVLPSFVEMA